LLSLVSQSNVALIGGGGHAVVVFEAARLSGWQVEGFYDDESGKCLSSEICQLGAFRDFLFAKRRPLILAVGNIEIRRRLIEKYDGLWATIEHPSAIVSKRATIASGTFIAAAAVVNPCCEIGRHVIINTRAVVEHHCKIGLNSHIAPGAVLGGEVQVGANTLIGISASVNPHLRIGQNCVIGAGSVVTRDVEDGSIVVGVPAKPIKRRLRKSA